MSSARPVIAVNVVRALFRSVVRQHSFPPLNTLALVHRLSPLLSRDRTLPPPPRICPREIGHLPPAGVGDGVRYVSAMVISPAAGSALGRARGPSKSWLGPKFSCGQLILRKISKFDATRCQILRLKCRKFDIG